jgi:hypothetical protein
MRRSSTVRDLIGTLLMFVALVGLMTIIILGEKFLENFKSH